MSNSLALKYLCLLITIAAVALIIDNPQPTDLVVTVTMDQYGHVMTLRFKRQAGIARIRNEVRQAIELTYDPVCFFRQPVISVRQIHVRIIYNHARRRWTAIPDQKPDSFHAYPFAV